MKNPSLFSSFNRSCIIIFVLAHLLCACREEKMKRFDDKEVLAKSLLSSLNSGDSRSLNAYFSSDNSFSNDAYSSQIQLFTKLNENYRFQDFEIHASNNYHPPEGFPGSWKGKCLEYSSRPQWWIVVKGISTEGDEWNIDYYFPVVVENGKYRAPILIRSQTD